jgi:hypothetical protein
VGSVAVKTKRIAWNEWWKDEFILYPSDDISELAFNCQDEYIDELEKEVERLKEYEWKYKELLK